MIYNYVRDNSFFQSLSESNSDISYKDFDNELNNFVNYLNKKVVTAINNIKGNSYNGVIGNKNYILKNIGNGKVIFDIIKNVNFIDNSISLNKIAPITPYSLIYVRFNGTLYFGRGADSGYNTGAWTNNSKLKGDEVFTKLMGENFYDKSINSNNIEANTITKDHISNNGKNYLLKNIKIKNENIINNSINNTKFSNSSITYDKLHSEITDFRNSNNIYYLENSVTIDKVKNNSFDFELLSNNLWKYGYGILHKKVIPLNSVVVQKPDATFTETIDTFKLCVYSIANAYQLNTYTDPQPDSVYVNPDFTNYVNQYNDMYKKYQDAALRRDTLYNNSVVTTSGRSYNAFSWALQNPTHGFKWFFENSLKISSTTPDNVRIINNLNTNYAQYWTERRLADEYQKEYERLSILISNTPKNIYQAQPPLVYQKLEAVPNTKSYVLNMEQQVIKSKHLKDNMLSMYQIPDRINYNNVPSEKFINKYMLSPELRTKLGLVI